MGKKRQKREELEEEEAEEAGIAMMGDDNEEEEEEEEEDELEATVHQETTGEQARKVAPTKRGRYVHDKEASP